MPIVAPRNPVRIESDGTPKGTRIFDANGTPIEGAITKIEWSILPEKFARAVVTFENVEIEATGAIEGADDSKDC
jgi:hypothetical protein